MKSKILSNRKGQIGKKVNVIIITIVSVVILFQIFASLVPEAQSAGDTMNASNRCNAVDSCFFNSSSEGGNLAGCRINSSAEGNQTGCTSSLQTIPLASVFSSSGIVILLLMVFLFLGALKIVMPKSKK